MIKVLIGNLLESTTQTIVNSVNCVGVMGKGIALEFKKQFPDMFEDYQKRCSAGAVLLGVPYLYKDLLGTSIINFPVKKHWRSPSLFKDIERGLNVFIEKHKEWSIQSVAFPPLGCGNGGLEWKIVGPMMYQKLSQLDIPIEIYAPFGTPHKELTVEFLSHTMPINGASKVRGVMQQKLNPQWIPLLEVLWQLEKQPYVIAVGRLIFQKICYVLTEQKIETDFHFRQGSYGPFSSDVNKAISVFANANLIYEQQLGQKTAIKIGSEYSKIREKFIDLLNAMRSKIDRTVDLFSRIKSTEQAEEVTTVLYVVRKLKEKNSQVSEQDVYEDVLAWKKRWHSQQKKDAIASAIRHLTILRWIKVTSSKELPFDELLF